MMILQTKPSEIGRWFFTVLLVLGVAFALPVWAKNQPIPALDNWLVDTTNTFTSAQSKALSDRLQALEKNKGAQIFVLVVPTTGDEVIEQYTRRAYDQWQVGREKIDDGILLVVAKDDRRLRIEVGYGLEGAVTDLQAGRIIREFITPSFVQGDYVGGINQGVDKLIGLVEGEELPPPVKTESADDGDVIALMAWPLIIASLLLPPMGAAIIAGIVGFFISLSVPLALFFAIAALVVSLIGKMLKTSNSTNTSGASRHGSKSAASRRSASSRRFGSGGGFGGGGGGFGGGGGGSSGGGGASGSW